MGANSKIEWTHHTFNPWQGCSKVSDGCKFCYAESLTRRFGVVACGDKGTRVRTSEWYWKQPLKWDREAAAKGERHRVFCASLADVFEDRELLLPWRSDLIDLIDATPNLDWLLLTKRPENVTKMLHMPSGHPTKLREWPMPNVWIGTSVENQEQADKRIPELLKIPAKVRFLSMEPLLGPVALRWEWLERDDIQCDKGFSQGEHMEFGYCGRCAGHVIDSVHTSPHRIINWVIVGGESGHNARPMQPDWARSLRDQCQEAGVAFHFKQHGEWFPRELWEDNPDLILPDDDEAYFNGPKTIVLENDIGEPVPMHRVGKHAAGRKLDGRTWDEVPEVKP